MQELFRIIEEKIKASGCPHPISGQAVYEDICDQIEEQENGTYLMMSKFTDDIVLEYRLTIREEDFNLEQIRIKSPEGEFTVEFDS